MVSFTTSTTATPSGQVYHICTMSTKSQRPTDHGVSVNSDGREIDNYSFVSEALGMPAENGYGWVQFEFGETVEEDQRYTIARKLGWGMGSSTWLARDSVLNKYVAIKALTGHMTRLYDRAITWETDALRLLSYHPCSVHCVELLDELTIPGRGSAGSHICFVMPVYGGDVKALAASRDSPFPLPLTKRIILHLLRGIAYAHRRGVVHTDLKQDNIFFHTHATTADIEKWIEEDPPRRHPPEMSHDGAVQVAMSQPMKIPSEEEALRATYLLVDFGSAHPSNLHRNHNITAVLLRAPEVFLGGEWDKPADIWSFGCLAYELATFKRLFLHQTNKKFDLSVTENILYQMMLYTNDVFRAEQLNVCPLAGNYFESLKVKLLIHSKFIGYLKKNPLVFDWPMEDLICRHKVVPDDDLPAMANFLRRCLRLDPNDRATAQELLTDAWLKLEGSESECEDFDSSLVVVTSSETFRLEVVGKNNASESLAQRT